jgi:hypothetical protein
VRRAVPLIGVLAVLGAPAVSAGAPLMPTQGQVVANGSDVGGECVLQDGQESGRRAWWQVSTVIPAFLPHGDGGGVLLAPPAEELPRFDKAPSTPFSNEYVEDLKLLDLPGTPFGCTAQSFDPLHALTLVQPGPYVLEQYVETVHFRIAPADGDPPPAQPCAANDPDFPSPSSDIAPPPTSDTWVADAFCNTVKVVGFYVRGAASCPASGNMSRWPGSPYINQYDAGRRLGLPVRAHLAGGNACGPSSLLMAMLATAGSGRLPGLAEAFRETVRGNIFAAKPALAFAKSLGWRSAKRIAVLAGDPEGLEQQILTSLANASGSGPGPVVISTAFGGDTWGVTGGGHMIAIVGTDGRGSFIVEDPAGNYFATPKSGYRTSSGGGGHYGPGSCGHRAIYPHFWVLAYTRGRWLMTLGARTLPRRGASPRAAAAPQLGSAISIADAHPGAADAPRSFYVQDGSGRRAGWIDGEIVEEIPDASVGQEPPGWTDPSVGDVSIAPLPDGPPPATPRSVVIPGPATGATLHVAAEAGTPFALSVETWVDGAPIADDDVKGSGTGAATKVAFPAIKALATLTRLSVGTAKVRGRAVTVPLACTGPASSSCRFAIALTAKRGGRTVTIAKRTAKVRSGKKLTVRLPAHGRKTTASLVVSQLRPGVPAVMVRSQRVRL